MLIPVSAVATALAASVVSGGGEIVLSDARSRLSLDPRTGSILRVSNGGVTFGLDGPPDGAGLWKLAFVSPSESAGLLPSDARSFRAARPDARSLQLVWSDFGRQETADLSVACTVCLGPEWTEPRLVDSGGHWVSGLGQVQSIPRCGR